MKMTQKQIDECAKATFAARNVLVSGDRVGLTKCPGTKRTITFSHFDGEWIVSKSGIDDYHAVNIYMVNGVHTTFKPAE